MGGSLLVVHGAGSGPWVFAAWPPDFPDIDVVAPDLQEGCDAARAGMVDYAAALVAAGTGLARPLWLCGWSMGGLVALQAAEALHPDRLVVIEPSPPAEVQGWRCDHPIRAGTFDPVTAYGRAAFRDRFRPESQRARDERKRGISVPTVPCPLLVVCGRDFPDDRGSRVAEHYGGALASFPDLSHRALIERSEVRAAIRRWLDSPAPGAGR